MSLNLIDFVYFLIVLNPCVSSNEIIYDLCTCRSICLSTVAAIGLYIRGPNPNNLKILGNLVIH